MPVFRPAPFPLTQASSNAAACQTPEVQGAQHTQARERPSVPGAHGLGRKRCHCCCAPTGSRQGRPSSHVAPCLPEPGDTCLCHPKGNKAPTLQGAQDSQRPDPDQLQLHAGIRQCREHHRANLGSKRQQGALIWRERHGVTACIWLSPHSHHHSTRQTLSGALLVDTQPCRVPGTGHMQPPGSVSFPSLSASGKVRSEPAAPRDTGASRGTSQPHLLPQVPTSAATPGSPAAFPRLSSSGCSVGTQRRNPDHRHCWDTATPQPSTARPEGAHGVPTCSQEGHPVGHPAPTMPCRASGCARPCRL